MLKLTQASSLLEKVELSGAGKVLEHVCNYSFQKTKLEC